MGLIVLILVGILPGTYALKLSTDDQTIAALANSAQQMATVFSTSAANTALPSPKEAQHLLAEFIKPNGSPSAQVLAAASVVSADIHQRLSTTSGFQALSKDERLGLRTNLYLIAKSVSKLDKSGKLDMDPALRKSQQSFAKSAEKLTNFIPEWVIYAVALALGLGTMVGYQRIVKTVGEKIGKDHLTYAQGGAAELVAMSTILAGDHYGLPISTTHVLSSGIAGTMAANNSGLQKSTVRNILLAWVLTLPVCVFLGAALFAGLLNIMGLLGLS
jgi:PiT family inorganic phosphate transporter